MFRTFQDLFDSCVSHHAKHTHQNATYLDRYYMDLVATTRRKGYGKYMENISYS
jgi:hypothetical protein